MITINDLGQSEKNLGSYQYLDRLRFVFNDLNFVILSNPYNSSTNSYYIEVHHNPTSYPMFCVITRFGLFDDIKDIIENYNRDNVSVIAENNKKIAEIVFKFMANQLHTIDNPLNFFTEIINGVSARSFNDGEGSQKRKLREALGF